MVKVREELPESIKILNEEQRSAYDTMVEFLKNDEKEFLSLIGYAGTGKTFTISKLIETLESSTRIAMTAPTNKAVKVLAEHRNELSDKVKYITIHKLLNLRLKWVYPKGGKPFQKLVRSFGDNNDIEKYDLLVVDEASMLDDELFQLLVDNKLQELKIIFMGDPAQIPPVNKPDSIPLLEKERYKYDVDAVFLEQIMRQAKGNSILETCHQIRNNRFTKGDVILARSSKENTIFCSTRSSYDREFFMSEMRIHFLSSKFKNDPNYCKTIAWRNKTVNKYNRFIRQTIFETTHLDFLMPGEKLIADTPVFDQSATGGMSKIIFATSDEFEVVDYIEQKQTYELLTDTQIQDTQVEIEGMESSKSGKNFEFKYYRTTVKHVNSEGDIIEKDIDILDPDSENSLSKLLSSLVQYKRFTEFEKMMQRFARVKYNYAITAHKAQGSTYGTVFLIEDDIDANPRELERNRIKCTACSRPATRLFILSSMNKSLENQ